jgi:hypothetical protein
MKNMTTPIITFRERPCVPWNVAPMLLKEECESIKIRTPCGIYVEWYKDGAILETLPNGDMTIFPGKPTAEVYRTGAYMFSEFYLGYMTNPTYTQGNYFEFHPEGSVIYRHRGTSFLWTKEFPGREIWGDVTYSMGMFDDDECRDSIS